MAWKQAVGALAVSGALCGLFGVASLVLPAVSSAAATPTCSTVSLSMAVSALGGPATSPTASTSRSGGQTTLECTYGKNDTIAYVTGMTSAIFAQEFQSITKMTKTARKVAGIGDSAFTFVGTSSKCVNNKCTTTNLPALSVLHGKIAFSIQWTKGTLAKEEALAREILRRS